MLFKLKNTTLSSPWLIALIPFVITLLVVKKQFNKYQLTLLDEETNIGQLYHYSDLNFDGNSEFLNFSNYQHRAIVMVRNISRQLEEVYNLPGSWFSGNDKKPCFFVGDSDNDGFSEIYAFTVNEHDSMFVSQIKHYPKQHPVRNQFVAVLPKHENTRDHLATALGLADNNGDGKPELLFELNAGFPLQPRAVYAWDLHNDSIYHSPVMGIALKSEQEVYFYDIDGDYIKEIFLNTVSTDNYKKPVPYSDTCGWSMVFTKNLEFLYNPVQFNGAQLCVRHFPYHQNGRHLIGAYIKNLRPDNNYPTFCFFDKEGKVKEVIEHPELKNIPVVDFYTNSNYQYLHFTNRGSQITLLLKKDLKSVRKSIRLQNTDLVVFFDLDADDREELIYYSRYLGQIAVVSPDLKHVAEITIDKTDQNFVGISGAMVNGSPDHFVVNLEGSSHYLTFTKNRLYFLNYLFAVGYYFMLVFVFAQLKKVWLGNLVKKQQTEQQMQQLQMQTVMNQLNPHFTFNAINTIGAAILQNNAAKAYDNLTKVSRLFRKVVDHTFEPYKTLGQEIDFVRDYLEVEKGRFGDKLTYSITVEKGVDTKIKIPKMLIQLFTENALKHGLFHKKGAGNIDIYINNENNKTRITVEDNGIGRQKAAELNNGRKGKGLTILKNYLQLFKQQFKREIIFRIQDKFHAGEACGTKVEIFISH